MTKNNGLFIYNDSYEYHMISRLFEGLLGDNLSLYPLRDFPMTIDDCIQEILERDCKVVFISNYLKKKVDFYGLSIAKGLREINPNIFIVLLTINSEIKTNVYLGDNSVIINFTDLAGTTLEYMRISSKIREFLGS